MHLLRQVCAGRSMRSQPYQHEGYSRSSLSLTFLLELLRHKLHVFALLDHLKNVLTRHEAVLQCNMRRRQASAASAALHMLRGEQRHGEMTAPGRLLPCTCTAVSSLALASRTKFWRALLSTTSGRGVHSVNLSQSRLCSNRQRRLSAAGRTPQDCPGVPRVPACVCVCVCVCDTVTTAAEDLPAICLALLLRAPLHAGKTRLQAPPCERITPPGQQGYTHCQCRLATYYSSAGLSESPLLREQLGLSIEMLLLQPLPLSFLGLEPLAFLFSYPFSLCIQRQDSEAQ